MALVRSHVVSLVIKFTRQAFEIACVVKFIVKAKAASRLFIMHIIQLLHY